VAAASGVDGVSRNQPDPRIGLTTDEHRRRRSRSIAIAVALGLLVVLF